MQAAITRIKYNNSLEDLGYDWVTIYIFFKVDDSEEFHMPAMINLDELFGFVENEEPETGKYLLNIRRNMRGYGPKHSKVLETLQEEGFDLDKYVAKYFSTLEDSYFQKQIEINKNIRKPEVYKDMTKKYEDLKATVEENSLRNSQIRYTAFLDAIEIALHETTFEIYPGLFEMGDKHVAAYEEVLSRAVLNFAEEIDKIRAGKFSKYFEEGYESRKKESE
ncbi:hypothetical protein F0919_12365 [Taibaiella lutea]|uniref:Uncharacterized protein n=1 Tax=Taibaiella lutea TaxID=2608001 RepID=A0A5M6CEC9_9BACT|nr:hypothetical protein [Taibaiella lutea]KAA5533333.1 hypothetical protein F0919_12365 [Taibaiella lutea]